MISRRFLRAKVLQALYTYFQSEKNSESNPENQLVNSLEEIHLLYLFLLSIPISLKKIASERLESFENRATHNDLLKRKHTYLKYNIIDKLFSEHADYSKNKKTFSLKLDNEILIALYNKTLVNRNFEALVEKDKNNFEINLAIIKTLYKKVIPETNKLIYHLQDQSIHWEYNEIDYALNMIIKTIETIKPETKELEVMPMFNNQKKDIEFGKTLLKKTLAIYQDLDKKIEVAAKNWDFERIAFIDILIIRLALSEAITFKDIPLRVTLNEYIELSKWYSTPKSSQFVNGILNRLIKELEKEKIIIKNE